MTPIGDELLALRSRGGAGELRLAPGAGGSVASYRLDGEDVLRPGSAQALKDRDPRGLAAFPLFPFSGRIENGQFRVGGRAISLSPNFLPEPHAIHGHAWQGPWRVGARTSDSATLDFDYDGADWPWAYSARQVFVLGAFELGLTLSLTNRGETEMPAGLGWHPYFPKKGALISAPAETIWRSGETGIPVQPSALDAACDLRLPRPVAGLSLDNGFKVGRAPSVLSWPERRITGRLRVSGELGHLVVFTPPGEDYFCAEPVSHAPNAVNSALAASVTGFRLLAPGETLSARIQILWTRD